MNIRFPAYLSTAVFATSILLFGGGAALAQQAEVSCVAPAEKVSAAELGSFDKQPDALLRGNPGGGLPLSESVRGLTSSSSNSLAKVMALVEKANETQRAAIAAGLARTVSACGLIGSKEASDYADQIQAAVASIVDPTFLASFQAAVKDIEVAALNASTASGGGATGDGGPDGATNDYKAPGDGPLDTTTVSFSVDYSNSYGTNSRATSRSGTGQ